MLLTILINVVVIFLVRLNKSRRFAGACCFIQCSRLLEIWKDYHPSGSSSITYVSRRNIDLVLVLTACLPDLGTGDMTIGGRGLFQADDGLGQLACKVVLVELAEHLFQLTSSAGGFDSLFHDFSNLSLDKKGRDRYNIGVARPGGCSGLYTTQTLDGRRCMGLFSGDVR